MLTQRRRVVAVAGADAHARLGMRRSGEPVSGALPIPSYEELFRTFSLSLPQLHLTGNAPADAAALVAEIRTGHVYTSVDAFAAPALLAFDATSGKAHATGGDLLPPGAPVALHVRTNAPADAEIALLRNGTAISRAHGAALDVTAPGDPAVYRVEVQLPRARTRMPAPWIVSNPIYVRTPGPEPIAPPRRGPTVTAVQYDNGTPRGWMVEKSRRSEGALDTVGTVAGGTQILMRYALGGTIDDSPYVALMMPAGPIASYDRLTFTARADRPMRLDVELRTPGGEQGQRWHRSVYLDTTPRQLTVFFDDVTPRGRTSIARPDLTNVDSVLFVVDSVNARPGMSGEVWIDDVAYGR